MGIQIEDGTGKGKLAGVTNRNQVLTKAITSTSMFEATEGGSGFTITTSEVAITTTGSYSGVLLIQPSATMSHINHIFVTADVTCKWRFRVNPTAGTLFTSGTALTPNNLNLGSTTDFSGTILKGANGLTVTDGDDALFAFTQAYGGFHENVEDAIMMTPESTFTIEVNPTATASVVATVWAYNHAEHGGL